MIPSSEISRLLKYDPQTGFLFWLPRGEGYFATKRSCSIWNARYASKKALNCLDKQSGYLGGSCLGRRQKAHRVAWAIYYGRWPHGEIDHINRDKTDNRIVNLRLCTRSENNANIQKRPKSSSSYYGVSWHKRFGKWNAYARNPSGDGKIHVGYFESEVIAAIARDAAIRKNKDHFSPLNFPVVRSVEDVREALVGWNVPFTERIEMRGLIS